MKKNRMMRLASGLMVAVLLTTSMISGTFAKYVTSADASDAARVAKWGVTIASSTTEALFAEEYVKTDSSSSFANTVVAETEVVAPGTNKEGFTDLVVSGKPEVAVRVTYEADLTLAGWVLLGGSPEYCPIIFKVEDKEFKIGGKDSHDNTIDSVAMLEAAVETAIAGCEKQYEANKKIDNVADAPTVSWEWPFYTSDENDSKDTYLGNQAAIGNAPTITLAITTTATQID